jgi:hypothetical protein
MGVTYISSLLRRDYKGIINQPAMQAWINKNAALVSIIARSLTSSVKCVPPLPGESWPNQVGHAAGCRGEVGALTATVTRCQ